MMVVVVWWWYLVKAMMMVLMELIVETPKLLVRRFPEEVRLSLARLGYPTAVLEVPPPEQCA